MRGVFYTHTLAGVHAHTYTYIGLLNIHIEIYTHTVKHMNINTVYIDKFVVCLHTLQFIQTIYKRMYTHRHAHTGM